MTTILNDSTVNNATNLVTTSEIVNSTTNEDMEVFLQLLTTQLENQNPLEPLDTNEFTQQLVDYSSLEQEMIMNDNLVVANELEASENRKAAIAYLEQEVELNSNVGVVQGGSAVWELDLEASASDLNIEVKDSSGSTVYQANGSLAEGEHRFVLSLDEMQGDVKEGDVLTLEFAAENGGADVTSTVTGWVIVDSVDTSGTNSDQALLQAGDLQFDDSYILTVAPTVQSSSGTSTTDDESSDDESETSAVEDVVDEVVEAVDDTVDAVVDTTEEVIDEVVDLVS